MAEFDSVIPAGGSGKVTAKVKTQPTQKGRLTKFVTVSTDAPAAESLRLILSFDVVPLIDVLPTGTLFIAGLVGKEATTEALLHRTDGKPLRVTAVEAEGSEGLVEIGVEPFAKGAREVEGVEGRPGDVWVVAKLVPQTSSMTRALRVFLTTDHPEMARVELRLSVRIQSLIEPAPKLVRLLASDNPAHQRRTTLRLTHTRGRAFSVVKLSSAEPGVFTAELLSEGKLKMHSVKVTLAEGADLRALEAVTTSSIEVLTDDPELPRLEVPVRIDSIVADRPRADRAEISKPAPAETGLLQASPADHGSIGRRHLELPGRSPGPAPAPAPTAVPTPATPGAG